MSDLRPVSWKELDEYCQHVLSDVVTVELIGRLGSRSKAAEELGISPAGINSRLLPVSKQLQGPVVEPKGSEMTPLGFKVRELWTALRPSLISFIADVNRLHDKRDLLLSVVKSVWEAEQSWMTAEYEGRMPGGTVTASIEDGPLTIEERVRKGDADVGITSYPPPEKQIAPPVKLRFWRNEQMMLVMSYADAYSKAGRLSTMSVSDLSAMPVKTFFTLPENTSMARSVSDYLRHYKVRFTYKVPMPSIEAILKGVINGDGISILPEPALERSAHNLDVEAFRLSPALLRPVGILYRENSLKRELIDVFIECVLSHKEEKKKPVYDVKKPHPPDPGQKSGNI